MAKKLLIEASHREEVRVALVKEGVLEEFFLETPFFRTLVGNVYKGVVENVEPTLQAAFVDIGEGRKGFLRLDEVHPRFWVEKPKRRPRVEHVMRRGQPVVVQVTRDELGEKGPALTTYLALPGRYLVLMPNRPIRGVSLKIEDGAQRRRFKEFLRQLDLPEEMGVIVRTAAQGRTKRELTKDLQYLLRLWETIQQKEKEMPAPSLLYEEGDLALRVIRDYFTPEVKEVLVDDEGTYEKVLGFFRDFMPRYRNRVRLYEDPMPLFWRYHVEEQVKALYRGEVPLPSGGTLRIDVTEALVAVDVNTSKSKGPWSPEQMAYRTNLEAAEEVPRQLRLRGLGGLVVIDFIDMKDPAHRREVERKVKEALKAGKAKADVTPISKLGMMEMSVQRLRPSLLEESHDRCPHCQGRGWVRKVPLLALEILRDLQRRVAEGKGELEVKAHPEVIQYLKREKGQELGELQKKAKVILTALHDLPLDSYSIESPASVPWYRRIFG